MKLYEFGPTRSIRARWTLQELGVDFEPITVNLIAGEHKGPAFLKINPAGKVPALVDGDVTVTESVAIALYLGDKYPDKGFAPKEPKERAELNRWLLFAATELEQPLWRITKNTSLYPEDRRLPDDVVLAREDFAPMAAVLEEHMKGRQFIVGNTATVADFVTAYTLDWANELQMLEGLPHLKNYMTKMYARPHAAPRIAAAFASLGINSNPNAPNPN